MFKALFKLVILLIVLVAVGGFFLGWWGAGAPLPDSGAVATAGQTGAEMAKRAGQEISQKTAEVAKTAQDALERRCADGQDQGEDSSRRPREGARSEHRYARRGRHGHRERAVQRRT